MMGKRVARGAVVVLAISFASATSASATGGWNEISEQSASASYAADHSTTTKEAELRLGSQQALETFAATWTEVAGDRLAGVWIDNGKSWGLRLAFTGEDQIPGLEDAVRASGLPIVISYAAGGGLDEALAALNFVADQVDADPAVSGVYFEPVVGEVFVLRDGGKTNIEAVSGLRIRDTLAAERMEDATRGGVPMSTCTSGFGVVNHIGTKGILTAGHCGNTQSYATAPGNSICCSTTYRAESRTASTDVQWHSPANNTAYNQFYGPSIAVTITRASTSNAVAGSYLCHRGKATGYSCGTVSTTLYRPTWSGACPGTTCNSDWVYVTGSNLNQDVGDSGGPWFTTSGSNGTAYGIHKGGFVSTGASVYMPIGRISTLSLSLL